MGERGGGGGWENDGRRSSRLYNMRAGARPPPPCPTPWGRGSRVGRQLPFSVKQSLGGAVILLEVPCMSDDSSAANRLLRQAAQGDPERVGAMLEQYRPRLRRMVTLRLDPRLHGRIDPSDVIQETYLEASARLAEY